METASSGVVAEFPLEKAYSSYLKTVDLLPISEDFILNISGPIQILASYGLITSKGNSLSISNQDTHIPDQLRPRKHHIVFLKTHKTGSSTFQNILFRLGEKEGLVFAFPARSFQFSYPSNFSKKSVKELPENATEFDIICSHMRLDVEEVKKVMPMDSVYLTILRDPVESFESVFVYYGSYVPAFKLASEFPDPLTAFLEKPDLYYNSTMLSNSIAKNPMAYDLGLRAHDSDGPSLQELQKIEKTFSLVMITEYFDESLILAKELLGLNLEDIIYLKLNARQKEDVVSISKDQAAKIRTWNLLDVALYNHFRKKLQNKIEHYGTQRMEQEVRTLRGLIAEVTQQCIQDKAVKPEQLEEKLRPWQPNTVSIFGYNLKGNLTQVEYDKCLRLAWPELQYHSFLYNKQYRKSM
nr:PREDICTED: galactosylceramide sulfotransferase-like [Latimeria chalumnae]|eukprot:XP_005994185.1 PREDICTED: galactosylceramide sulfotransferase-like [Latimeria chalumnae]